MNDEVPKPCLDNNDKLRSILQAGAPELLFIKDLLDETQMDVDVLMKGLYLIANTQRMTRWGKVSYLIQDGQIVRVEQEQGFKLK
jgi:hypothetical protein